MSSHTTTVAGITNSILTVERKRQGSKRRAGSLMEAGHRSQIASRPLHQPGYFPTQRAVQAPRRAWTARWVVHPSGTKHRGLKAKLDGFGEEPLTGKYCFGQQNRNDKSIRLIYCGTLRDEENIMEIIDEFRKLHRRRPEVVLKIVYGKIAGNPAFTRRVTKCIKEGVKGVTFKYTVSHKIACYDVASSDVGISWRKKGWPDDEDALYKLRMYKMYGTYIVRNFRGIEICSLPAVLNKKLFFNNIIVISDVKANKKGLLIELYSRSNKNSTVDVKVDNKYLPKSRVLLNNGYKTPNFVDPQLYKNYKIISLFGDEIDHVIMKPVELGDFNIVTNFQTKPLNRCKTYKASNIFGNQIAFIGDDFTYDSLSNIVRVKYISKNMTGKINYNDFDFLLCESTWHGRDDSWKYAFNCYKQKRYSQELVRVTKGFRKHGKKCIYYNKEDPTNFEKFYAVAELFDIIVTTSELCVGKYKDAFPGKIVLAMPFLCNPISHNPIDNAKEAMAYFVGGFYNHLENRTETTNSLFASFLNTSNRFTIINRHYFFPKLTRQIKRLSHYATMYEIDNAFEKYNSPSVSHMEALSIYKRSLFHLNVNTVTACPTMCSRRLIELLACGCNVYSNPSQSIARLKLPVITELNQRNVQRYFTDHNIEGFYLTHTKYSYVALMENMFALTNVVAKSNVKIKISCADKSKIPKRFKSYLNRIRFDFELLVDTDLCCDVEVIEKHLVYPYFFDGNVCFTKDKSKYFTVERGFIEEDCLIKYHGNANQTLYIPRG